jgi:aconitase B
VAQAVNAELKAVTEESFVNVKPNPLKGELETKLELVKHIIAVRIKQAEDIKAAVEKSETRRKVMDAIIAKRDAKYTDMTEDQLMKELEKLEA